jgi:DNA-directed RNA polymerase specialized sigma24 family protein
MLPYIDARLVRWAEWSKQRGSELGFPKEVAFAKMRVDNDRCKGSPDFNEEAWDTEKAVQSLHDDLRHVIKECYINGGTETQKARALKMRYDNYKYRLHIAHVLIMEYLQIN